MIASEILVPPFSFAGLKFPALSLGKDIEFPKKSDGNPFTAAEYQTKFALPTLAELVRAYFVKPDGKWLCPEYRESVMQNPMCGEWTSTFLQFKEGEATLIERPDSVWYAPERGWITTGGERKKVRIPQNGYVMEYDACTGLPAETISDEEMSKQLKESKNKRVGTSLSYSMICPDPLLPETYNRLSVVYRNHNVGGFGPFYINAMCDPGRSFPCIGGRACCRTA